MSAGKVALGVLAGVAVGFVIGMLVAPDKGSKSREKLLKRGSDFIGETGNKVNRFVEKMTNKLQPTDAS